MGNKLDDITGKKYGRLLVINRAENTHQGSARWNCLCDCGKTTVSAAASLRKGHSQSCGCLNREKIVAKVRVHGCASAVYGNKTPEYMAWAAMKYRCQNPNHKNFQNYGGRGITVCEEWDNFERFLKDVGHRPSPRHSLDRINNNGNYEPSNCRWATSAEQMSNTRKVRDFIYQGIQYHGYYDLANRTGLERAKARRTALKSAIFIV